MSTMIIEQTTDLGTDALAHPGKYKGFMGISIMHKFFSKKNIKLYIEWASQQFIEFVIILIDDPEKYDLVVFEGLNEEKALEKSRTISDEIKCAYEKNIRTLEASNVRIFQFRDFSEDPLYQKLLHSLQEYKEKNDNFHECLMKLMQYSIGNKISEYVAKNNSHNELSSIKKVLSNYITEELTSLIYLTQIGYTIEIDPTIEFSTKKLLYEGEFPSLYNQLQLGKRGHIYIHPEGIHKSSY